MKPKRPKPSNDELLDRMSRTNTKLTVPLIQKFVKLVKFGHPASTIVMILGIAESTFHKWFRRGEQFLNGGGKPKEHKIYGAFVNEYRKAAGEYLRRRETLVHNDTRASWYKHMVVLERRDRKNWSKYEPQGGSDDNYSPDERFL